MRKLIFAMVMTIGAAACAEVVDDPPPELEGLPVPPGDDSDNDEIDRIEHPTFAAEPSQCAMLPTDDSACAHACDANALEAFIPAGTCVIFDCPLNDGTSIRVGGCRP
jgi:hypothetical protein